MAKAETSALGDVTHPPQLPRTAFLSQSDRTWQTEAALDTTPVEYTVDPADPWDYDILVLETPDREMFRHVVEGRFEDTTVLFRMRGDPYWGIGHWYDGSIPPVRWGKKALALKQLEWVDGCIAIADHQAAKYQQKTGNPTKIATLSRDTAAYPDTTHTDTEIRALTLTNCMYPNKIGPIIEHAAAVNDVLDDVGGQWVIGGKGRYADRLADAVEGLEHVTFPGYVDAKVRLADANLMLHLSDFDSFAGAVLEGCASALPVITTSHPAFTDSGLPVDPIDGSPERLKSLLYRYADPDERGKRGYANEEVVREEYSHERLGRRWMDVLQYFHAHV